MKNKTDIIHLLTMCLLCLLWLLPTACTTPPPGYTADTTPGHNGEAWRGGADNMPGPAGMRVEVTDTSVAVGFDLLGIREYQVRPWARESWGPLKILTYPIDYTGYMIENHPGQVLVAGLAAWELTDNGVSDTLGGLFGGNDDSGSARGPDLNTGTSVNVSGNNNTITVAPDFSTFTPAPSP